MLRSVLHVVAARPNFMKVAPVVRALWAAPAEVEHLLVHTGQHYDEHLNDSIFRDLELKAPDVHLGSGSGTHAEQTARIMLAFEKLLVERRPALVVTSILEQPRPAPTPSELWDGQAGERAASAIRHFSG
jgi:UDP-N-acetylglucosamine 2-epimerase (non-hydrolysing)